MQYGIFLRPRHLITSVARVEARRWIRSAKLVTMGYCSLKEAQAALAAVPFPHRNALEVSEYGWA